jgi:soluble lytic murein transglycosylase-like protein
MRRKAAKNAFATKKKEVADRIETELRKIISDQTGARGASIQKRIDNEADIMNAQRLANQALSNLGIKPGTGAVTANAIYKTFATDEGAEPASEEPSQAEEEEVVSAESGSEPEPAAEGQSYDIDSIIAERDAGNLAPLIKSIYEQESSSGKADTSKQNYAGAKGPMQVTKDTFDNMKDAGMLPEDYSFDNVSHLADAGFVLIQDLARRYGNDPEKIAAAYYGGPRAVTERGIRRERRDPKNPKAPTVRQYADQVLARLMPTAQAGGMARGGVVYSPAEEMLLKRYANR